MSCMAFARFANCFITAIWPAAPGLLALIELQNGAESPSYVAGTQNFYVITRYNWSSYYAMSVLDLGNEVKAAMAQ